MLRLLISLCLIWLCVAQDDIHLKIAEKLAIPHYTRHAYDYPAINFQRLQGGNRGQQVNQGGAPRPQGFSQPDPFSQPAAPIRQSDSFNQPGPIRQSDSFNQPGPIRQSAPLRQQQPFSSQPNVNQPVRQTRFFNLYTPSNRPEFRSQFGLDRRES